MVNSEVIPELALTRLRVAVRATRVRGDEDAYNQLDNAVTECRSLNMANDDMRQAEKLLMLTRLKLSMY